MRESVGGGRVAQEEVVEVDDDDAGIEHGEDAFKKDEEAEVGAVGDEVAVAEGEIGDEAEIEGGGEVQKNGAIVVLGGAETLGGAGEGVDPEVVKGEEEDDGANHETCGEDGGKKAGAFAM